MKFEIVSPTRVLFSGEADEVVLPTEMGEIGVLPGHARLLSITVPGSVQIRQGGQRQSIEVGAGFLEVDQEQARLSQKEI